MVIVANTIQANDGTPFRSSGLSYQFYVRAAEQPNLNLVAIDSLTTRTVPSESSRAYGGFATDLNEDGWMDITIVNEDTADLRTFLNRADSTGLFEPFLTPPAPVNDRASPSEPSDFNRDGHADVCVVNIDTNSVSVLLGRGDGTFHPQQEITVGSVPRGIAVLDVDGDGDTDIVNSNLGTSNIALMLNDGNGVFGKATFFDAGANGEWSLAAADMDNDNLLDIVVGAQNSQRILVNKCNGDGTFSFSSSTQSGGRTWMLSCGDLNGDGNNDVASVNSSNNNATILMGDGSGGLAPPSPYATDNFPLAIDLGDFDGDGDLDLISSSFAGDWLLFTNDGAGNFSLDQELFAPVAASCSLAVDIDNDRDLDLVLVDELEDVIIIMQNGGLTATPQSVIATRGNLFSGSIEELSSSDNADLVLVRSNTDVQSWTEFEVKSVSSTETPGSLILTLEGSVFARSTVNQTIELFNYDTSTWDPVDTRKANRFDDSIVNVDVEGDLARFVEAATRCMRARVRFQSVNPRQQFASRTDLFTWTIR